MLLRLALFLFCIAACVATPARAEDYAKPSWESLAHTLVRFNAIDFLDNTMVDEYSIITECEIYKAFFKDDFKWNDVRKAVRQSVAGSASTFPASYHYDITLFLDRYDFDRKIYRFTEKSSLHNVNTFVLYSVQGTACGEADVKYFPRTFRAVLSAPIYLEGLPFSERDARALQTLMTESKNKARALYAHFNLSVVYVEAVRKITQEVGREIHTRYRQANEIDPETARLDVRLDSIDFYEDQALTRLIFHYQP